MPNKYKYQLSNGRTLTLEGDSQPSDDEVDSIAREQGVQLSPADSPSPSPTNIQQPIQQQIERQPEQTYQGSGLARSMSGDIGSYSDDTPNELSSSIMSALRTAANPQTASDFLGLVIPAEIPNLRQLIPSFKGLKNRIGQIGESILGRKTPEIATTASKSTGNFGQIADDIADVNVKSKPKAKATKPTDLRTQRLEAAKGFPDEVRAELDSLAEAYQTATGSERGMIGREMTRIRQFMEGSNEIATGAKPPTMKSSQMFEVTDPGKAGVTGTPKPFDPSTLEFSNRQSEAIPEFNSPSNKPPNKPPVGVVRKRLNELYDKSRNNTLTGDELVEARKLTSHLNSDLANYNNAESIFPGEVDAFHKTRNEIEKELRNSGHKVDSVGNITKPSQSEIIANAELERSVGGKRNMDQIKVDNIIDEAKQFTNKPLATTGSNKPPTKPPINSGGSGGIPPQNPKNPKKPTLDPRTQELLARNQAAAPLANKTQKKSLWAEVRDANRALLTTFDFSAPGRQGKSLILTKAYWTSLDDMVKSWGSQAVADNVVKSIMQHPNFQPTATGGKVGKSLAERAGLAMANHEEMFQSNIAEKFIPLVKRSDRAYTSFLSKLRADHFNTMIKDARAMGMNPDTNDVVLKQIGSFINDATGRGSLGKLQEAAPILNELFFAPRLMASRINMYKRWLDPRTYSSANPVVRQQAIKSLIGTVGFGMAVGELAKLGGAQVSNESNSSDFRKAKIGDSRIDPFSGFQQYAVGASRLISGESVSTKNGKSYDLTSNKFGMPTRASVAGRFFQNKLAPVPSFVWSWMQGVDWNGEPFEVKKAILDRTVPIVAQDLYEIWQQDPDLFPEGVFKDNPITTKIGESILPIIGEGIQTYGR